MRSRKPLDTDDLIHLLDRASAAKTLDAEARRTAACFVDYMVDVDAIDDGTVASYVRERFDAVSSLTRDAERHEVRHAALFALGRSGDARAAEPLLNALMADRDLYDHDFVFMAFAALGHCTLPTLVREALSSYRPRRAAALHALGGVRDVPVDTLRAIAAKRGGDKAFMGALFNQRRAELLSLALPALSSKTASARLNAMSVVSECVRLVAQDGHRWPDDVTRGAVIALVAPIADDVKGRRASADPHASLWGWAVETLAMLGDGRAYEHGLAALDDRRASESARTLAPTIFGWFPDRDDGWQRIRTMLASDEPSVQLQAAYAMVSSGPSSADVIAGRDAALALVGTLPRDDERWHDAIAVIEDAPGGPEAARAWIDPKRPRARETRLGLAVVVELAARDALPDAPGAEQRARLDEILLPCDAAVRRLADEAWRARCRRARGDLTYARARRR